MRMHPAPVLDMTVSIRFTEDYLDPWAMSRATASPWAGTRPARCKWRTACAASSPACPRRSTHGHRFHYVSPNSDMLGWIIERASGETIARAALASHLAADGHGA